MLVVRREHVRHFLQPRRRCPRGAVPSPGAHDRGVFVDVTRIRKDGTLGKTSPWQTIAQRTASSLHVAWSTNEWGAWKFFAHPRHYLTEPQREALTEEARRRAGGIPIAVTELFDPKTSQERSLHIYVPWLLILSCCAPRCFFKGHAPAMLPQYP